MAVIAHVLSLRMQLVGTLSSQSHVLGSLGAAPCNTQAIHPSPPPPRGLWPTVSWGGVVGIQN